jgi:hypothetical protein
MRKMLLEVVEERLKQFLPGAFVGEGYGLTETLTGGVNTPIPYRKPGFIGIPFISTEVDIVDLETGSKKMPRGQMGEIVIKGPCVMKGYWNKPEETKQQIREGWLYTGDIGMTPGWGGTYRLGRLVGRKILKRLIGALLDPYQAKELQLVNKVVPANKLDEAVNDLIEVLLSKPQEILAYGKFIIQKGMEADLHTALGFEVVAVALKTTTQAMKESTASFRDKSPLWVDRRKKREEYYRKYPF